MTNLQQSLTDNPGTYYIGVDVGSSSVRAVLVNSNGAVGAIATHSIQIFEYQEQFYEQSSDDIWSACCKVVNSVHEGIEKSQICGIGFDGTCSLVVLDKDFKPLSVSPSGQSQWNVVMWMDHRAEAQTNRINSLNHSVSKYTGGAISLEMQTPKLLWLKENMKEKCWDKAGNLFDLPDFLTWRSTASTSRSLCSTVCKWTYVCDTDEIKGWNKEFFHSVGLEDLVEKDFQQIGRDMQCPGEACGQGLTEQAAKDLGLLQGTPVSTSIIDAHAGGLGSLSCHVPEFESVPIQNRMALICGTSTCHMAVRERPVFVEGVWGPYFSAMIPDMWLNEGGQSTSGKLIDHLLQNHPSYTWVKGDAENHKIYDQQVLSNILEFMVKKSTDVKSVAELSRNYHIYPDFYGNRSPLADASLKGMISGLTLSSGTEDLALQYLAVIQALAYSTRHIIETMNNSGHDIRLIHACGGLAKNKLYLQTHADVTGLPVIAPQEEESVLLGSAILAAKASGRFHTLQAAMEEMGGKGAAIKPDSSVKSYHNKKYTVFKKMLQHQLEYREIMKS